jgi:hypothetical protein
MYERTLQALSPVFLKTQVSPNKSHASPSKLLAEVVVGYLDKLHGDLSMQAHAARQSPPTLLGTRLFRSFKPMHEWNFGTIARVLRT